MKKTLLGFLVMANVAVAQHGYWQQHAEYKMDIDFDATKHQFKGKQQLVYTNNSPDTLYNVFYHLYFNAFQPGSMMDVRSRTIMDPDSRVGSRIFALKENEIGFQKVVSLKQNGKDVNYEMVETILEVKLNEPILPGASSTFDMEFHGQVPIQIRRSGRDSKEGVEYSMTQWYPKLCEYDIEGWHPNPYIAREFHGIWGNFDVKITIDSSFVIGGTGYLQNPQEIGHGYEDKSLPLNRPNSSKLTWHFYAPNVHDFAWGADRDYIHTTHKFSDDLTFHFFYQPDESKPNWEKLPEYMVKAFQYLNSTFGEYPYQQYSFIQGGDGGMEYPMCTLVTSHGDLGGLISVCIHEAAHSWFQGVLATNEAKYAWMDEGFTTYAQNFTMDYVYNRNQINPIARSYKGYTNLAVSQYAEPLTIHSDHYKTNYAYGTNAYSKGSVLLHQLSYVIGKENLEKGMLMYYNTWKFKHPTVRDFKRIMEKVSGLELDWYFEHFVESTNTIDYAIKEVSANEEKTNITLARKGAMPMPMDVVVKLKNGKTINYYIPLIIMRGEKGKDWYESLITLEDWPWTTPAYSFTINEKLENIEAIVIDPTTRLADVDLSDNTYPFVVKKEEKGKKKKKKKEKKK
ncbi:MAG: M1 family metallopeptidase [Bacteroidia bacterium]